MSGSALRVRRRATWDHLALLLMFVHEAYQVRGVSVSSRYSRSRPLDMCCPNMHSNR
jgi:hypothetical protein